MWGIKLDFEADPELMQLLPSTLTELTLAPDLACSVWHLLPPNLTNLTFNTRRSSATEVQRNTESLPFDRLPRSITKLEVFKYGNSCLCGYSLASNPSCFPPNLTYLELSRIHPPPEMTQLLPSSLTHLCLDNLCERVCEYLPSGLKTLISRGTLMSPNLIGRLPKSLTCLKLVLCDPGYIWFDYNNGQKLNSVSKLPEYSIHQECLSNNFDWKQTSPLPSTLIKLEIFGPNELGDLFLEHQQLPNLLELRMSKSKCFTDLSIPLLPRHLTALDLQSSSMVSGKSFKFLPRYLTTVSLNSSESIFDSDIQHLPRTLKRLNLEHAIHLTDLCIADLPPHLELLRMFKNSLITPSSFHLFPLELRSKLLDNSASFQKWSVWRGKINITGLAFDQALAYFAHSDVQNSLSI